MHLDLVHTGAETQVICSGGVGDQILNQTHRCCKKPIRIVTDRNGDMTFVGRMVNGLTEVQPAENQPGTPSISIGTVNNPVAFGSNASTTMNVYDEAVKMINEATNISDKQKSEAKGALAYFKTHEPAYMPIAAEMIKKTPGL